MTDVERVADGARTPASSSPARTSPSSVGPGVPAMPGPTRRSSTPPSRSWPRWAPAGFTVDEVAARAGCGKATIYRRWPSRAPLLLDTGHHRLGLQVADPDTGSVRDDLVAMLAELASKMRDTAGRARSCPRSSPRPPSTPRCASVLAAFVHDRRKPAFTAVGRGVARGELPEGTDVELVLDLLGGLVYFRVLISRQPARRRRRRHGRRHRPRRRSLDGAER